MTHRFILILFFFSALAGCGGGSDAKKAGTQNGDEQKAAAMAGYKLPNLIEVLEAEE
ncbi:hypothetical protein N9I89_02895 [Porticoccaceae bacterium]|nr:hypothetical protein [Porticoccaceae bacterium]MDA8898682.1 hypothetical protein [Porticoccaceae bacterium]